MFSAFLQQGKVAGSSPQGAVRPGTKAHCSTAEDKQSRPRSAPRQSRFCFLKMKKSCSKFGTLLEHPGWSPPWQSPSQSPQPHFLLSGLTLRPG